MLNTNELTVLKACADNAMDAAGGDFGFTDEIHDYVKEDLSANQVKGYLSSLVKKGLIEVDESVVDNDTIHQITLDKRALEVLVEEGKMTVTEAEAFDIWHRN